MAASTHESSTQEEQTAPSYLLLAHPEQLEYTSSTRNKTQFRVTAPVYAIPQPPHDFQVLNISPPQNHLIHYELTFLSRHALHVRFQLDVRADQNEPFPDDPSFPPAQVREQLCTGHFPTPQELEAGVTREGQERMACGLELRAADFNTWVNPYLRGGMEYQFVTDEDGNMGLEGFYNYDGDVVDAAASGKDVTLSDEEQQKLKEGRKPLWKLSTRGPFSHASMPAGVADAEGQLRKHFELFEFAIGENLGLQFKERKNPAQQGSTTSDEQGDRSSLEEDPEAVFLWSDRGWGCLVKDPLPIRVDRLSRIHGPQIMLSVSTKSPVMEYVIVAGEALETMMAEYGPKPKEHSD